MPHLPLEERKGFEETEPGLEEESAIREAKRCLSCRRCIGCGLCLAECDPRAVVYDEKPRMLRLKVGAIVLTPGFDEFEAGRIRELGYRQFANVITSIELERMLSRTGPYGGKVLRPHDGEVPTRIAFVQCVGSRDEALGADYCSSVCCMSAMREALSLVRQINDARVTIFHRDMRPFGKGSEEFYQTVLKEPRVDLIPAAVSGIEEAPESGNLVVEFSSASVASDAVDSSVGGARREEYDLVVLSVGMRPSSTARAISRKTGVRLNKYGFCQTSAFAPILASKAGIVAAGAFTGPRDIEQSVCQADAAAAAALRSINGGSLPAGDVIRDTAYGGEGPSGETSAGDVSPPASSSVSSSVLVIGSGVAGLTAAIELSNSGHEVTIIEKEREPGGIAARFPVRLEATPEKSGSRGKSGASDKGGQSEGDAHGKTLISSLLKAVEATGRVKVLTSTELGKFSGEAGHFSAVLRSNGSEKEDEFGAVVICTGGREHIPEEFLHGKDKRVVTQFEFENILNAGELEASSIAMIQCVGSRSSDWPVCSRTCCEQALRNALKVKQLKPETKVVVFHRDIRVYFVEEELFSEAKEKGIEFVRLRDGISARAMAAGAARVAGEATPTETVSADYVVLSTGFRPHPGVAELASMLGVEIDDKGFFAEVHPGLRPVESSRNGIYICGLAHSPQSISETIAQAMAAARKASSAVKRLAANVDEPCL